MSTNDKAPTLGSVVEDVRKTFVADPLSVDCPNMILKLVDTLETPLMYTTTTGKVVNVSTRAELLGTINTFVLNGLKNPEYRTNWKATWMVVQKLAQETDVTRINNQLRTFVSGFVDQFVDMNAALRGMSVYERAAYLRKSSSKTSDIIETILAVFADRLGSDE